MSEAQDVTAAESSSQQSLESLGYRQELKRVVNSLGHMFGKHPYQSGDHSGNIAWLSVVSFGDSWHNSHHAFPALARHGCDRGQIDPSASVLRMFEGLGWASQVKRPTKALLTRRSTPPNSTPQ